MGNDEADVDAGGPASDDIDHHELGPRQIERLGYSHSSIKEFAGWFGLSPDEMRARLEEPSLARATALGRAKRLVELREAQFELAKKNPAMAMFLGRLLLGQTDANGDEASDAPLIVDTGIRRDDLPSG